MQMKKYLFLAITVLMSTVMKAQDVDDVTLIVNGTAETKEVATQLALRSAIEQAYGVFVSANTTILNDELVRDEIATVTSGNVKSYTEVDTSVLPTGMTSVTLEVVVSTKRLISYAQSKGSSIEFAGATLWANRQIVDLNIINTKKAIENLAINLATIAPHVFEFKVTYGTPSVVSPGSDDYNIPMTLSMYSNDATVAFTKLLSSTLKSLEMKGPDYEAFMQHNGSVYNVQVKLFKSMHLSVSLDDLFKKIDVMLSRAAYNFVVENNLGDKYITFDRNTFVYKGSGLMTDFWKEDIKLFGPLTKFMECDRGYLDMNKNIYQYGQSISGKDKKKVKPYEPEQLFTHNFNVTCNKNDLQKLRGFEVSKKYDDNIFMDVITLSDEFSKYLNDVDFKSKNPEYVIYGDRIYLCDWGKPIQSVPEPASAYNLFNPDASIPDAVKAKLEVWSTWRTHENYPKHLYVPERKITVEDFMGYSESTYESLIAYQNAQSQRHIIDKCLSSPVVTVSEGGNVVNLYDVECFFDAMNAILNNVNLIL